MFALLPTHYHRHLTRLALALLLLVLVFSTRAASVATAATVGLRVQGVTLVNTDGSRFVVAGINMEMYRDYDNGCGWVTDGTYAIRGVMADKVKALGVNAVRLNYSYRFLQQSGNLTRFLDMAQELANRGMYVMPSDHTYTGGVLSSASASYPMMKSIIDGMRARGLESYLIMNPWNEPGPDISVSAWVQAQKDVLTYLRNTAGFQGVVVMDGTGWATLLDVSAFQSVMSFDAGLRGTANVAFSMHLYPNITGLPSQLWTAARQVPLVIGELGQENPGASPLDPNYVKSTISGFLNTGMPNGHNGLFAWIFAWCDSNNMLEDWTDPAVPYSASSPLTAHGVLWRDNYYSKLPASSAPVPTTVVEQPTATKTTTPVPATATTTPRPATSTVAPPPGGGTTLIPPPATGTVPAGESSFYRGINLGGGAMTVGSHAWEASASAPNFTLKSGTAQACNPFAPVLPAPDTATSDMLKCYVEHWSHSLALSAVPNASYDVYVYTWQDWSQPSPGTANFSVNGAAMQTYALSSQAGHWDKLGPWRVTVTNGSLTVTTNGNNIKLSGVEVWRAGSATAQPTVIVQQPTATKTSTPLPPTATRTTVPATATRTSPPPTATKTNTPRPATATRTTVPATATRTSPPPTATKTNTPRPATATATRTNPPPPAATSTVVPGESSFYRAINLGGSAVTIANHAWEASSAPNFSLRAGTHQECNIYVPVVPAVDAATEQMVECFAEHWNHNLTLSAVPSGSYVVYLYTWQDWNQPTPGKTTFKLNGAVAQANYAISSQTGRWERLGPWPVTVTGGTLSVTSNGNNIKLSGLEVWRVDAPAGIVMAPTATVSSDEFASATGAGGSTPVTPSTDAPTGFYRAVNLNGRALTLDGQRWEGANAKNLSVDGRKVCQPDAALTPVTDPTHAEMLRCYVTGNNLRLTLRGIPAGSYQLSLYLWDQAQQYTLKLQGGRQTWVNQPNANVGSWQKVGPWTVTVDASGTLLVETDGVASIAGIVLWHADSTDVSSQPPLAQTFVPGDAGQPLTQVVESDDARLSRSGEWQAQSTGKASGGSYLYSSNAQLSFTFTGSQFDVVYVQHKALGSFTIAVDGVIVQTVDSHSEQTHFQAVASVSDLSQGQHTVVIAPADGAIAIDALRFPPSTSMR
ncbi:MAG: cellulase family glycosylhydrolase [Anaerolineae bacterium]|nr:cellulase family glycosylhydrolase [Anaerolineae bacterium]